MSCNPPSITALLINSVFTLTVSLQFHDGGQAPFALPYTSSPSLSSPSTHSSNQVLCTPWNAPSYEVNAILSERPDAEVDEVTVIGFKQDYELPSKAPNAAGPLYTAKGDDQGADLQMKDVKTKATIGVLSTLISYVSLNSLYKSLHPEAFIWQDEDREEDTWLASSKSWLDRKACRWLSICGAAHLHLVGPHFGNHVNLPTDRDDHTGWDWQNAWTEGGDRPEDWTDDERVLREIPDYVLNHAPLVHLFSGEQFWPCDIAEHLYHITPTLNYTPLPSRWDDRTLQNLDELNEWERSRYIFLTSNDDVEERPEWLEGEKNIPIPPSKHEGPPDDEDDDDDLIYTPGRTLTEGLTHLVDGVKDWFRADGKHRKGGPQEGVKDSFRADSEDLRDGIHGELKRQLNAQRTTHLRGGRSDAPAVLIVVNKGHGIVDAFWFFFYSFNLGNVVLNVRFGNHVGDWEHSAIRFHNGEPKAVFFSEHNFGSAYSYDAVEKIGERPVIYSATGTHAMYSTPGLHPYVLPWGILHDETDRGPLWDPVLNSHAFTYDFKNDTLRSSNLTPEAPTSWFHFAGHWGDKFYPLGDKRQYRFAGQYHYVNGPLGPKFKNLGRKKICGGSDSDPCVIKNWLIGATKVRRWQGVGEGEEVSATDAERFFGGKEV